MQHVNAVAKQLLPQSCSSDQSNNQSNNPSPLDAERARASFDSQQLTYFLDGGQSITELKQTIFQLIENDPELVDPDPVEAVNQAINQTIDQARARTQQRVAHVVEMVRVQQSMSENIQSDDEPAPKLVEKSSSQGKPDRAGQGSDFESAFYATLGALDPSWSIKAGVHWGLFAGAVSSNGNQAINQSLNQAIRDMKIIGCFAMTEMGHGSNVSGLETTMTYDPDLSVDQSKHHLIVHSPTLTSTKWWIGGAASTATHASVFARLLIPDNSSTTQPKKYRDCGVHCIVVQLRDVKTGAVLPNIQIGDMGPKMGRNGLDNGWIRFHHTKVPFMNLLNKHFTLTPDPSTRQVVYKPPAHRELTLGALIGTRAELVLASAHNSMRAAVIGVRYSCVRKQGANHQSTNQSINQTGTPSNERTIIDYVSHRARVLPSLSTALAQHFTARACAQLLHQFNQSTNQSTSQPTSESIKALASLHATCAGLKAHCTWQTASLIESIRQSCGGMGYSMYAGLATMANDWAVMCSWEGDNTILALQCTKYLLKQRKLNMSQPINQSNSQSHHTSHDDPMYYLSISQINLPINQSFDNPACQLSCLQSLLLYELDRLLSTNQTIKQLIDQHASECLTIALLHCHMFQMACFHRAVRAAPASLQPILTVLSNLHWSTHLTSNQSIDQSMSFMALAATGCFGSTLKVINDKHVQVREWHRSLLDQVRQQCIPLTDAFSLPDYVIGSPLGRADGHVYEHMFDMVKRYGPTNQIPAHFDEFIKPITCSDEEEEEQMIKSKL